MAARRHGSQHLLARAAPGAGRRGRLPGHVSDAGAESGVHCPPRSGGELALPGRFSRGRELLRARLTRRGFALSTGLLTTLICANSASASVTAGLVHATLKTALSFGAGAAATASPKVIALSEGVVKAMLINKVKLA